MTGQHRASRFRSKLYRPPNSSHRQKHDFQVKCALMKLVCDLEHALPFSQKILTSSEIFQLILTQGLVETSAIICMKYVVDGTHLVTGTSGRRATILHAL